MCGFRFGTIERIKRAYECELQMANAMAKKKFRQAKIMKLAQCQSIHFQIVQIARFRFFLCTICYARWAQFFFSIVTLFSLFLFEKKNALFLLIRWVFNFGSTKSIRYSCCSWSEGKAKQLQCFVCQNVKKNIFPLTFLCSAASEFCFAIPIDLIEKDAHKNIETCCLCGWEKEDFICL